LRVGLISLAAPKNLVDAEIMLGALLKDGGRISRTTPRRPTPSSSTLLVYDAAQEESGMPFSNPPKSGELKIAAKV